MSNLQLHTTSINEFYYVVNMDLSKKCKGSVKLYRGNNGDKRSTPNYMIRDIIEKRLSYILRVIGIVKHVNNNRVYISNMYMNGVHRLKQECLNVLYTVLGCGEGICFTPDLFIAKHYGTTCWNEPRSKFTNNNVGKELQSYVSTCYIPSHIPRYSLYLKRCDVSEIAREYKSNVKHITKSGKTQLKLSGTINDLRRRLLRALTCGNSQKIYRSFQDNEMICLFDEHVKLAPYDNYKIYKIN